MNNLLYYNLNTLNNKNDNNNSDIKKIKKIIKNIDKNYKYNKYLGEFNNNSFIHSIKNTNNKPNNIICKEILIKNNDKINIESITNEIQLLNILNKNPKSRKYINPCIKYKKINNKFLLFFPKFNGITLNQLIYKLKDIDEIYFVILIKYIIKQLLEALHSIHKQNLSHQNINLNTILVNVQKNKFDNQIKLKIIGFNPSISKIKLIKKLSKKNKSINKKTKKIYKSYLNNKIELDNKQKQDIYDTGNMLIEFIYLVYLNYKKNKNFKSTSNKILEFLGYKNNSDKIIKKDLIDIVSTDLKIYIELINKYMNTSYNNIVSSRDILKEILLNEKYEI